MENKVVIEMPISEFLKLRVFICSIHQLLFSIEENRENLENARLTKAIQRSKKSQEYLYLVQNVEFLLDGKEYEKNLESLMRLISYSKDE